MVFWFFPPGFLNKSGNQFVLVFRIQGIDKKKIVINTGNYNKFSFKGNSESDGDMEMRGSNTVCPLLLPAAVFTTVRLPVASFMTSVLPLQRP